MLGNGYGTVALVRRALLESPVAEPHWPLFAQLSLGGARIVSVPMPLASRPVPPARLETHPAEALRVLDHFERALPDSHRFLAEFVTRAAAGPAPAPPRTRSFARRVLRRLVRGLKR